MELFWYNITCNTCGHQQEKTFSPSGSNYAERYNDFATTMQQLSWANNAKGWMEQCSLCRKETLHQLNNYAPAYGF